MINEKSNLSWQKSLRDNLVDDSNWKKEYQESLMPIEKTRLNMREGKTFPFQWDYLKIEQKKHEFPNDNKRRY